MATSEEQFLTQIFNDCGDEMVAACKEILDRMTAEERANFDGSHVMQNALDIVTKPIVESGTLQRAANRRTNSHSL